jgi:protein TonB
MSKKNIWLRRAPILIAGVVVIGVTVSLIAFVKSMMVAPPPSKKMVQQISLIQPPPPPKVEKPPEPEIKEEVKLEEPEPTPEEAPDPMADDAPMGDDLALDAEGMAGGDAFGLLGKKGGRDLIGSAGSNPFAWYAASIQSDIVDYLSDHTDIRKKRYSVKVRLWISGSGQITRSELLTSTGDSQMDNSLTMALKSMAALSDKPPQDLPQPINLQITSRI